jgi:two-component system nitrate/nitrite sensor histidine kinase NarX
VLGSGGHRPIIVSVGLLMAVVLGLGLTSMLSSMIVAQINRGMAAAVNQSGTLRMQSYRIATAMTDTSLPLAARQARAGELAREYDQRIRSTRLTAALPRAATDPARLAYERVRWRWASEMRPAVSAFATAQDAAAAGAGRTAYLAQVDDFVGDIHALVRVLEERSERRIELLRWLQVGALLLTLVVVLITLLVVQRRVVLPLGELLRCADRVRHGDFSRRSGIAGSDELGRLGAAMDLMTDGLSRIYEELEERIAAKSRDLARTNHSLELLYRTSRTLDESPISEHLLRRVLLDLRAQLGLAEMVLCLRDAGALGCGCIATAAPVEADQTAGSMIPPIGQADCRLCGGQIAGAMPPAAAQAWLPDPVPLDFPVGDAEQRFGLLRALPAPGQRLESWQRPLLESVAAHLATALALRARAREGRRLVLHEERSIMARELHDSLAQSLSYLKIQAARLDAALRAPDPAHPANGQRSHPPPAMILAEMRSGIASAYRQLRELLTTFRLKMDGAGLGSALADTTREFAHRGGLSIRLRDRLPAERLSANEEVHLLQIVREALSNVVRHAQARVCRVVLGLDAQGDVCVAICDDGRGPAATAASQPPQPGGGALHHGTTIMRERARSLGGRLTIMPRRGGGTRVCLRFRPRTAPAADDVRAHADTRSAVAAADAPAAGQPNRPTRSSSTDAADPSKTATPA